VYTERPIAVVINLFYTGLGIARSLGERGIPVVGLSAHRNAPGNFSRYVRVVRCADSILDPELLRDQLVRLGQSLGHRAILFPTRDADLVFMDRFRDTLEPHFRLVLPSSAALLRCLDKWETFKVACETDVPVAKSWLIQNTADLIAVANEVGYPCVLKPVAAHHWRSADNWAKVGGRKAIGIAGRDQLIAEYASIAQVDARVLVQETIPGPDDCLMVAACYIDGQSRFRGGFNVQKLIQTPSGFGTGCVVQSADEPGLFDQTTRLLSAMKFTGIAEVEFKRDPRDRVYKLIEVNPRPWDQHRLGPETGVDLMYLAYCDHAGLPPSPMKPSAGRCKWIAEDAFLMAALRLLWRREPGVRELVRQARGRRIYGIWSARDPLPFLAYITSLVPVLAGMTWQAIRRKFASRAATRQGAPLRASR
jgi:D-aspartate ligase